MNAHDRAAKLAELLLTADFDDDLKQQLTNVLSLAESSFAPTMTAAVVTLLPASDAPVLQRSDIAPPDLTGTTYELVGLLGVGGMGEVWRVFDPTLRRNVAMKCLRPELGEHGGAVARFIQETQATAQLQHPGIVPIHAHGRLCDGRFFFTMREVRGQTFTSVIHAVHAAGIRSELSTQEWTFHRALRAFHRVCETIAYVHRRGVIHRDLKPDNLMFGDHGEVLVLDWGIAKIHGVAQDREQAVESHIDPSDALTRRGSIPGTPGYMAPEQLLGRTEDIGPHTDVYGLGACLYQALSGKPPHTGMGPVAPLTKSPEAIDPTSLGPSGEELVAICERALAAEIADRTPSADALAEQLEDWIEGTARRARARALVSEAQSGLVAADEFEQGAERARQDAERVREGLDPWSPTTAKEELWRAEDEASRLAAAATQRRLDAEELLQQAMLAAPDLEQAHTLLAERWRAEHERLEAQFAPDAALLGRAERRLRQHVDSISGEAKANLVRYLANTGALTLITEPPGRITLSRYELVGRRLEPVPFLDLGETPVVRREIPAGSYLAVVEAEGFAPLNLPIVIERLAHTDHRPPGADQSLAIPLMRQGDLAPGEVYVPPGWFRSGGDPLARGSSLALIPVWLDGFIIQRDPMTFADYLAELDALLADGQKDEALVRVPSERGLGRDLAILGEDGRFVMAPGGGGSEYDARWPLSFVDWFDAQAIARARADRTGQPWRLPHEFEFEKAARGVDSRIYPWGNHFEPSWCRMEASADTPDLVHVADPTGDESPYGVRHCAGLITTWMDNVYRTAGPSLQSGRLSTESGEEGYRAARGGAWSGSEMVCRCASRLYYAPSYRFATIGIRLVRSCA